jgi:hypothetical protein
MHSSEVVPTDRVSTLLEYLTKRIQNSPELKSKELRTSVCRACELIATQNSIGRYSYGSPEPTYSDDIVLDAFKVCMTLGMREPLQELVTAFRTKLPEFAIQSLRNLISEVGFGEIEPM